MPRRAHQPSLSIVIAAPDDAAALEDTLVSVLEKRPDGSEVIVALGCDYDDPWNIREEVTFVQAPIGSSLVACVNVGVAASRADVTHVLAAGWRATENWTAGPLAHFADERVAAVVPLTVTGDDDTRGVHVGVRCGRGGRRIDVAPGRPAARAYGPALEAGFWRTEVLRRSGPGFSTSCGDSCADADMAVTIARGGWTTVTDESSRVVRGSARERKGAFLAGLHAERLFWRSLVGQSLTIALAAHGLEVIRHAVSRAPFGTLPMLAGRLVGLMQFGAYFPRARQLRVLMRAGADGDAADGAFTIRIDGPHGALPRPKHRDEVVPLRRSA